MSGGPVLNSNNEVVGIVYAGNDDNSETVGFISLV
jgi:V8-like Glu-specific endopeptidase